MDNSERLRTMKRLYYYKGRAKKKHDIPRVHAIEMKLDSLRVRKKDDPEYKRRRHEKRERSIKRAYERQKKSGYFRRYSRQRRMRNPEESRKANRRRYRMVKSHPTLYRMYLENRKLNARKRQALKVHDFKRARQAKSQIEELSVRKRHDPTYIRIMTERKERRRQRRQHRRAVKEQAKQRRIERRREIRHHKSELRKRRRREERKRQPTDYEKRKALNDRRIEAATLIFRHNKNNRNYRY